MRILKPQDPVPRPSTAVPADYMIYDSQLDAPEIRGMEKLTFGANDRILLHRPAGPPAPPGMSLNSLDTGPFTLVPIISLFAFSRTQAVSSNLADGQQSMFSDRL